MLFFASIFAITASIADDVQDDKDLLDIGGRLYKGAKTQKANAKITKAIKHDPENADLYLKRAANLFKEKKYEQAWKDEQQKFNDKI